MIELYGFLPRIIKDKAFELGSEPSVNSISIFGTLYSNKISLDRYYGQFQTTGIMRFTGLSAMLISEESTDHDCTFQLAVNGTVQTGTDFLIPAGAVSASVTFPTVTVAVGDWVSLYCSDRSDEEAGVYVEVNYTIELTDNEVTVLKKLVNCFDNEVAADKELLEQMKDLLDIDDCPEMYLSYIGSFLGYSVVNAWSLEAKRHFIKSLGDIYKTSGQRMSFEAVLNMFGYSTVDVIELYKKRIYETHEYTATYMTAVRFPQYSGFWPGALIEDTRMYGFFFPDYTKLQGMEVHMLSRDSSSGAVTIYLTVNGVVDTSRYIVIPRGKTHAITTDYYFPELEVMSTDIIGFLLHIDHPNGVDNGWIQIYLHVAYATHWYYAARYRIDADIPQEAIDTMELLRPIHVLRLDDTRTRILLEDYAQAIRDELRFRIRSRPLDGESGIIESLAVPSESFSFAEVCGSVCETVSIEPIIWRDMEPPTASEVRRWDGLFSDGDASDPTYETTYARSGSYSSKHRIPNLVDSQYCEGIIARPAGRNLRIRTIRFFIWLSDFTILDNNTFAVYKESVNTSSSFDSCLSPCAPGGIGLAVCVGPTGKEVFPNVLVRREGGVLKMGGRAQCYNSHFSETGTYVPVVAADWTQVDVQVNANAGTMKIWINSTLSLDYVVPPPYHGSFGYLHTAWIVEPNSMLFGVVLWCNGGANENGDLYIDDVWVWGRLVDPSTLTPP